MSGSNDTQIAEPPAGLDLPKLPLFYGIALVSTAVGIGVVFILNVFTPLEYVTERFALWMGKGRSDLIHSLLKNSIGIMFICILPLAGIHRILRPVRLYLARIKSGLQVDEELETMAKRRAINFPYIFTPLSLAMWVLVPASVMIPFHWVYELDIHTSLFLVSRAAMVGLIASTVSLFFLERYARNKLIPYFFPQGRLSELDHTAHLDISRRILLLYVGGTLVPLVILISTIFMLQFEVSDKTVSAHEYGRGIFIFSMVLCGYSFFSALRLNKLVSSSVARPLRQMLRAVDRIQKGDYNVHIQVVSNDEIGELGDAFNDMIQGLAEREKLRKAFGKYVNPEIRDEILSGRIPLQGERREGHYDVRRPAVIHPVCGEQSARGGDRGHAVLFHRHAPGHPPTWGGGAAIRGR
jgi:adenylate cyclase